MQITKEQLESWHKKGQEMDIKKIQNVPHIPYKSPNVISDDTLIELEIFGDRYEESKELQERQNDYYAYKAEQYEN